MISLLAHDLWLIITRQYDTDELIHDIAHMIWLILNCTSQMATVIYSVYYTLFRFGSDETKSKIQVIFWL